MFCYVVSFGRLFSLALVVCGSGRFLLLTARRVLFWGRVQGLNLLFSGSTPLSSDEQVAALDKLQHVLDRAPSLGFRGEPPRPLRQNLYSDFSAFNTPADARARPGNHGPSDPTSYSHFHSHVQGQSQSDSGSRSHSERYSANTAGGRDADRDRDSDRESESQGHGPRQAGAQSGQGQSESEDDGNTYTRKPQIGPTEQTRAAAELKSKFRGKSRKINSPMTHVVCVLDADAKECGVDPRGRFVSALSLCFLSSSSLLSVSLSVSVYLCFSLVPVTQVVRAVLFAGVCTIPVC